MRQGGGTDTDTERIGRAVALSGAGKWGTVPFSALVPHMSSRALSRARGICPDAAGVIVAAFPYFAGYTEGNVSMYARGEDYHKVVLQRLGRSCEALEKEFPGKRFIPLADASPLPEKLAAAMAGMGVIGRSTLFFCDGFGSFVFLGCILTDAVPCTDPEQIRGCAGCLQCVRACPTRALRVVEGRVVFEKERCVSAVTQRKGELSAEQEGYVRAGGSAWGCDVCQKACPMNRGLGTDALDEFKAGAGGYINSLDLDTLLGMDDAGFFREYSGYAFSWRGRQPLIRNLRILEDEKASQASER